MTAHDEISFVRADGLPSDWDAQDCFASWQLGIELAREQVAAGGEVPRWLRHAGAAEEAP
jgi:hypothetical protein